MRICPFCVLLASFVHNKKKEAKGIMTFVRLGYVAMSMELKNASPSKTMTYAQFSKLADREAAIRRLEKIAKTNLKNCLRLLIHNEANGIKFFRFSSKLIPLANHPELKDWKYMESIIDETRAIKDYLEKHPDMRIDFHPDHFVVLNSEDKNILKASIKTLRMHHQLLKAFGLEPKHRCVLHVGGLYQNKEQALEQFIYNWGYIPVDLQEMIILENDDTLFNIHDTLYLCEKLLIPMVFDLHHHKINNHGGWKEQWPRIVQTWSNSKLPVKVHLSSPKEAKNKKAHADHVQIEEVIELVKGNNGQASQIDCMLEAKYKDFAVFKMMEGLQSLNDFTILSGATFSYDPL